jgi:hypothetical protein
VNTLALLLLWALLNQIIVFPAWGEAMLDFGIWDVAVAEEYFPLTREGIRVIEMPINIQSDFMFFGQFYKCNNLTTLVGASMAALALQCSGFCRCVEV